MHAQAQAQALTHSPSSLILPTCTPCPFPYLTLNCILPLPLPSTLTHQALPCMAMPPHCLLDTSLTQSHECRLPSPFFPR